MEYMTLTCKTCGGTISDQDISVRDGFAQCPSCRSVFRLGELSSGSGTAHFDQSGFSQTISPPKGISSLRDFDRLTITRTWFSFIAVFLIPFTIIWNAFLAIWVRIAVSGGQFAMLGFSAIHIAVGIYLIYYCAALILNKTVITLKADEMSIHHGPLPWPGAKSVLRTDSRQFYGKQIRTRTSNGQRSSRYQLWVLRNDGNNEKILDGLQNRDQVLFLEQEIERFWAITDTWVDGQLH